MEYNLALAGGTFDHLHEGHRAFLRFVFSHAQKVILGLTSDTYIREKKHVLAQVFSVRKENLENFLRQEGLLKRTEVISIDDIYGPIALDKNVPVDVLIATTDTKDGAEAINRKRNELGMATLPLEIMPLVTADNGTIISSTAIRNNLFAKHTYILPKMLRHELHQPFGEVISEIPTTIDQVAIITVGDETTKRFLENGYIPKIAIVDFVVEREHKYNSLQQLGFAEHVAQYTLANPPGQINLAVWELLKKMLQLPQSSVLFVDGEEDLLVLPSILLAPIGYKIYYGQPQKGLVEVDVTQEIKNHARGLLGKFEYTD